MSVFWKFKKLKQSKRLSENYATYDSYQKLNGKTLKIEFTIYLSTEVLVLFL